MIYKKEQLSELPGILSDAKKRSAGKIIIEM